ncbi:MAG: tetratricopeptide repeat protein [Planctomycetota bacterium]|nr:tetratricopeptide repeat protein [Planctomycetota bacterium]
MIGIVACGLGADLKQPTAQLAMLALQRIPDEPEIMRHALVWSPPPSVAGFRRQFDRLYDASPVDALRLGEIFMDQGRYPEATSVLEWITQRQPERSSTWQLLARCYTQLGRHDEARLAHQRANQSEGLPY